MVGLVCSGGGVGWLPCLKPSRSVNLNQPEAHYLNSIHPETSMLQLMNLAVTEDSARVPDIMVFYTVCKCKL
ncbi:hypothetical protein D0Y65_007564 [Glycine soja]|uniref:Uncharacterized protein n=1 Tax=Glycine soja TaxID=3848 RepID=A0A445LDT3_GLYSO|nr:hypothetical protein D0Y65_007564 [Glycine soja]